MWDEPKRLVNLQKHGLDFAQLEQAFSWEYFVKLPAPSSRLGRRRLRFVGTMNELTVVAIVSPLGQEALSVISLRQASSTERRSYERHPRSTL